MDLFSSPLTLLEDAEGGVRYWPGFALPDEADAWSDVLQRQVPWKSGRRMMYDRMVDVPRLLAAYRTSALPPGLPLREILGRVAATVPAPYSAVGLNLYRDGADSVAMHNDKLHTVVPGHPITLLSLGARRRMLIRAKTGPRRRIAVDLEHGSLLAMSYASQLSHEHGIPKTAKPVGPRMSIVFRVRPLPQSGDE